MEENSLFNKAEKRTEAIQAGKDQKVLIVNKVFEKQVNPILEKLKLDFVEKIVPKNFLQLINECEKWVTEETEPKSSVLRKEKVSFNFNADSQGGRELAVNEWISGKLTENPRTTLNVLLSGFGGNVVFRYESPSQTMWCAMGAIYTGYSGEGAHLVTDYVITKKSNGEEAFNKFVEEVINLLKRGVHKRSGSALNVEEILNAPRFSGSDIYI